MILALGLVFMITGAVQAQMKMEFGVKAGGNMANLTGDVEGTSMKLGIGGGIFAKIMPSPQITIQPEVLYMMKGAKHDDYDEGGVSYTDGKSVIDYVEVPILVKYMIPTEGKISPSIFVGPAVGFLMSAKDKYTMDGTEMEDDWKDYFKSIDFGVAFGAGVDVAMGEKGKLTFDARYTLGLTNLYDLTEDEATAMGIDPDASVKNANISVMVGYAFPIGGE
jgi:hypothetical protein